MSNSYYTERLSPFKSLWKVNCSEWIKQRESDWEILKKNGFSNYSESDLGNCESYFLRGDYDKYIPESTLFLMTPVQSASDAKSFFYSDFFGVAEREKIMLGYLFFAPNEGAGLTWLRQHMQYFIDGVLGSEYKVLKGFNGTSESVFSPSPTGWCGKYSYFAIEVLSKRATYHSVIDCVDYFVSALAYADKQKYRKRIKLNEILNVVDDVLAKDTASEIAKEFAQNLKEKEEQIKANWALNAHLDT